VDYTAHEDLYGHLSSICSAPGNSPFDAIIDCVGNMVLYYNSPGYLKLEGEFISIESSSLIQLKSNYLPTMLGGGRRTYKSVWAHPSGALAEVVTGWFEKGWIKELPVDSVLSMDDALQVIHSTSPDKIKECDH
jgi:hypothetical protein